jgi:hypothetical protein
MPANHSTDEFPFHGTDEQIAKAARRTVKKVLNKRKFKGESILPKTLINTVFVVKSCKTKQRYRHAFIQEKVAAKLRSPEQYDLDNEGINPLADMPPRRMMLEGILYQRWDTELAKLEHNEDNEAITWVELPENKINEMSEQKISSDHWESWATDFLIFANKLWSLKKSDRGRKGGEGKRESRK